MTIVNCWRMLNGCSWDLHEGLEHRVRAGLGMWSGSFISFYRQTQEFVGDLDSRGKTCRWRWSGSASWETSQDMFSCQAWFADRDERTVSSNVCHFPVVRKWRYFHFPSLWVFQGQSRKWKEKNKKHCHEKTQIGRTEEESGAVKQE